MTFDAEAYSLTIRREEIDGEPCFVGKVLEFPDICAFESDYQEAREVLLDAITSLYELAQSTSRPFPKPLIVSNEYSGRVTLRLPRSLHRDAALLADREGVSLNQLIAAFVAEKVGANAYPRDTAIHDTLLLTGIVNRTTASTTKAVEIKFDNFQSALKESGARGK